jgi:hypothetical protein
MLRRAWRRRFTSPPAKSGGALDKSSAQFVSMGLPMRKSELLEFHEREGARYRRLLANVTTPALKIRLTEHAQEHERLAAELEQRERSTALSDRAMAES